MIRPLARFGPALLVLAGILVLEACEGDDGGESGRGICERLCTVSDGCGWVREPSTDPGPIDAAAPLESFRAGPAPYDESGSSKSTSHFTCIDSCVDSYRESSCFRAHLPALLDCVERDGCHDDRCRDEALALADCSDGRTSVTPSPKEPAPPAQDEGHAG